MVARCIYELVNHARHEVANIEDLSLAAECWLPDEASLIEKWSSKVDGFFCGGCCRLRERGGLCASRMRVAISVSIKNSA